MNTHSHTHTDRSGVQGDTGHRSAPGGLWKLLAAAVLILFGLIAAMEAFGDGDNDFIAPGPPPQTVVE